MGRGGGMGGRRSGGRSSGRRSFGGRSSSGGRGGGFRSGGRTGRGGGFRSGGSHGGALGDTTYYVLQFLQSAFLFVAMTVLFSAVALVIYVSAANFIPSLEFWAEDYFAVSMIGCGVAGFVITLLVWIRFIFPRIVKPAFTIITDIEKAKNKR